MEEKAGWYRGGVFGIALHATAALARNEIKSPGESRCPDTLAPVTLAHEATRDAPVGQRNQFLFVGGSILDPWQFGWSSVLAPADAVRSLKDERCMGRSLADALVLALAVERRVAPCYALGMEADAPASAEDPVVALDECRECRPGRLVEGGDPIAKARYQDLRITPPGRGLAVRA